MDKCTIPTKPSIKETSEMIEKKDMDNFFGMMAVFTKVNGSMEFKMGKDPSI